MSQSLFAPGKHVHFVGIAGSGMSGIAGILLGRDLVVSGSDSKEQSSLEPLRRAGATIFIGHNSKNIDGAEVLVISAAISADNPEVSEARKMGIPVLARAQALAELLIGRRSIAVAGTHGKTTTSGMLAWTLTAMGEDPSFVIGSLIQGLNSGSQDGSGDAFIVEADESDGSFMRYHPWGAVITNLELDHVDNFKNLAELRALFTEFVKTVTKFLVLCGDDQELTSLEIPPGLRTITYGINEGRSEGLDLQLSDLVLGQRSASAGVSWQGNSIGTVTLGFPGRHNLLNAGAVIATLLEMGFEAEPILTALATFQGTARRFELKGESRGVTVVDDYGHHPTEIHATLAMARSYLAEAGRLVAIFQPHRYSRTAVFYADFARALADADLVFLMDIYSASEKPIDGVTSRLIAGNMDDVKVRFPSGRNELIDQLVSEVRPGDLVLTLGAGDITQLGDEILERLGKSSR